MKTWNWLYNPENPFDWKFVRNVIVKASLLFIALNVIFVLVNPLPTLGKLSGYNVLFRGRDRLPYGENPSAAYNLSLYQLDAMFASHKLSTPKPDNEYRVILIGDSSVWGILLRPDETLAGQLNATYDNTQKQVQVYNVGYPTMSLLKDLMILDYAMRYDPDLIVWMITLESFDPTNQLDSAIVQNNADQVKTLISTYTLDQHEDDPRLVEYSLWEKTLIKQRRALADILRLQYYGIAWSITGIDQEYRDDYTPRAIDLTPDDTWHGYKPDTLSTSELAFDIINAGIALADDTPVLLINEPIFISSGENSDTRYNAFYPRWAYDEFRGLLYEESVRLDWMFLDLWNLLPDAECYTDSAVHLTPDCSAQLAGQIEPIIIQIANSGKIHSNGIDPTS